MCVCVCGGGGGGRGNKVYVIMVDGWKYVPLGSQHCLGNVGG